MVDKATFKLQCDLIADALNVIWADQETRSPHHPLRQLNELFGYAQSNGLWGTRHDYIDSVYDNGAFPSRAVEPHSIVVPPPDLPVEGFITIPIGTGMSDPARFTLKGNYKAGDTIQVSGTLTGATLPTWDTGVYVIPYDMSREHAAVQIGNFMRGIDELSTTIQGNRVSVFPVGGAATAVEIQILTIIAI